MASFHIISFLCPVWDCLQPIVPETIAVSPCRHDRDYPVTKTAGVDRQVALCSTVIVPHDKTTPYWLLGKDNYCPSVISNSV